MSVGATAGFALLEGAVVTGEAVLAGTLAVYTGAVTSTVVGAGLDLDKAVSTGETTGAEACVVYAFPTIFTSVRGA